MAVVVAIRIDDAVVELEIKDNAEAVVDRPGTRMRSVTVVLNVA